ncbi:MAG: hypothetical protein LBU47_07680 [Christensenellaceae bacterium]|jgi:hypothetical protein|nr:hypothetical protein [Christensenellaceae bacterium]
MCYNGEVERRGFVDYAIRFLACLLKWMVIVAVAAVLCFSAFTMAMNVSHIYVLVTEGMNTRLNVAVCLSDEVELPKFFAAAAFMSDPIYEKRHIYSDYDMQGAVSEVKVTSIHALPWEDSATVRLEQIVESVTGYLPIAKQTPEQLADPNKIPAPSWEDDSSYELELQREGDGWKIVRLTELPKDAAA